MKKIKSGSTLLALVVDLKDIGEGITPVTDPTGSLQLLMRKHKKGHTVAMHGHKQVAKTTTRTQEGLVVMKGKIKVLIADSKGKRAGSATVAAGQCVLFIAGAHSVEVTKPAAVYEFKNGPYVEDKIIL